MNMLHQLKNSKKMNKNEETESLMIGNVPELVEAARREVVVGEVAVATTEFCCTICYTCCNAISFEGIDMHSIANEIVN
jgi:hypothetical protein